MKPSQNAGKDKNQIFGTLTGIVLETADTKNKGKKRIASPDLWEYTRLKGGNVLNLVEDANIEKFQNVEENELDEEVAEIELNDEEAPFLKG